MQGNGKWITIAAEAFKDLVWPSRLELA